MTKQRKYADTPVMVTCSVIGLIMLTNFIVGSDRMFEWLNVIASAM